MSDTQFTYRSTQIPAPPVELHFPLLKSNVLPVDHTYSLYSAICKIIPTAHAAEWLGIHSIKGQKQPDSLLRPTTKLRLRLPMSKVPELYALAGATLDVGGHTISLGIPELHMLRPSSRLRSGFVVIKVRGSEGKFAEPDTFLKSLQKQLDDLGVSAKVELETRAPAPASSRVDVSTGVDKTPTLAAPPIRRRAFKIKSATVTGFAVLLSDLSPPDSLLLQSVGLGGKRRLGCGLFDPIGGA